jgi:GNAT superfamily N-acetyltransferase
MGGLGQVQYDLLVPFVSLAQYAFFRATTNTTEATERTRSKYQGTVKISPLIVREEARSKGVNRMLLQKLNEYAKK